jgi:hypothetical protein
MPLLDARAQNTASAKGNPGAGLGSSFGDDDDDGGGFGGGGGGLGGGGGFGDF